MEADLMNKDKALIRVKIEREQVLAVVKINEGVEDFLPPMLLQGGDTKELMTLWGRKRMPNLAKREGLADLRQMHYSDFPQCVHFFSLTDQYWYSDITEKQVTWEKKNFFTNLYSPEFGTAVFSPWKVEKFGKNVEFSPELTTNGVLKKRWRQDQETKKSFLVKAGSKFYHQEPLSEILATIMLERLDLLPFVPYELTFEGVELCSMCKNFVTENTEFVPMGALYTEAKREKDGSLYNTIVNICKEVDVDGAEDFLNKMITIDYILQNHDRHLGNFGFIRDVNSGKYTGFAPLFDFSSAYWGENGNVGAKRLFDEDAEKKALREILRGEVKDKIIPTEEMEKILSTYPGIDENTRHKMQKIMEKEKRKKRVKNKEMQEPSLPLV